MSLAAAQEMERLIRGWTQSHVTHGDHSSPVTMSGRMMLWKTLFDRGLALMLLIPGLPLIGIIVALVRLTSRGPGVYSQMRVGKGGRIFTMHKIRTMRIDAEAATGPVWSGSADDPRVTLLGRWLRRLHFDELPQLINVLRGEMSLVGPRPERPEFVQVLAAAIPGYLDRLLVLPGVTGLAQINLPPDTDLDSVRRKLELDREYIGEAGVLLDLRILVCTMLRFFGLRGGRGAWLVGLQRTFYLSSDATPIGDNPGAPAATPESIVDGRAPRASITTDEPCASHFQSVSSRGESFDVAPTSAASAFGDA